MTDADKQAVWHILQLAEQGRFEHVVGQMIASAILSSDANSAILFDIKQKVEEETLNLLIDPSNVWEGLLPGAGGKTNFADMFALVDMTHYGELDQAHRNVKEIVDIVGRVPDAKPDDIVNELTTYFLTEGLVKEVEADPYEYVYSIIRRFATPSVRHDESSDLIQDARKMSAESVLNIATVVQKDMDLLDKMGRWPAEEMAVWISKPVEDQHWIMTWDQANAIVILNRAEDELTRIGFEDLDTDDIFQGIQDQMALAGAEYIAGRSSR